MHRAQVSDHCWVEINKGGANDIADRAVKHLVHCAQASDHYWVKRSEGGANNSADGAVKHL
eukprot:4771423-Ditylum_brightwellii.AAC.1